MRTDSHNSPKKKPFNKVFTSLDNQSFLDKQLTKGLKATETIQENEMKENRNSHTYVTSPYDQTEISSLKDKKNFNCGKERPTMGGKTVSNVNKAPMKARMSTEELKSLSRRINPKERLATPHSSPTKPPLPTKSKKRHRENKQPPQAQTQPTKSIKMNDDAARFICEPCNKKYKTRSGYLYHKERCKYATIDINIQCICQNTSTNNDNLIECKTCKNWLHTKCIGSITNEDNYNCFSCTNAIIINSPKLIKLSELCPTQEIELLSNDQNNYISLVTDEEPLSHLQLESALTPPLDIKNEFNDWITEIPCLSFSDVSSPLEDFSSSELLMSPTILPQSDWFRYANFEVDFEQNSSSF